MKITKKFSNSVFIGNFICTLLVVAIHYNTKKQIIGEISGWNLNYYIQEFITNGIARVAVPYFAVISGFFFFLKFHEIRDYIPHVKSRIRSLLIPYLLTSALFFFIESLYLYIFKSQNFSMPINQALSTIFLAPVSVQHWFLRDLMVLTVISPVLFIINNSKFKKTFLTILLFLWILDIEFLPIVEGRYLVQIEVLACFCFGAALSKYPKLLEQHLKFLPVKTILSLISIYIILLSLRIYIQPDFLNYYHDQYTLKTLLLQNLAKIIGVYLIFIISFRLDSKTLVKLSSYSFFLYLFHGVPLNRLINKFSDLFIDDAYKFYLNFPLSVLITLLTAYLLNKYMPNFYGLVTGGRNKRSVNPLSKNA